MAIGSQSAAFDTELTVLAPFTGVAQLLGTLTNNPAVMFIKNTSTVDVFFADNPGSTKGTTMVAGERIVLDCSTNRQENAYTLAFNIGTKFYVTGTAGSGSFKVSIIYAK
jgi:hypothetical protein